MEGKERTTNMLKRTADELEYDRLKALRDKKTQDARDRHYAIRDRDEAEFHARNPQFTVPPHLVELVRGFKR
jgi:hypothetical protein